MQLPNRETDVSMSDSSDSETEIFIVMDTQSVPDITILEENNKSVNTNSGRLDNQSV